MKRIALLLLLTLPVYAADVTFNLDYLCPDGNYAVSEAGCACQVTATAGANCGQTDCDAQVVLVGSACSDGVLHTCLDLSADADISRANCVANSGMVGKKTATDPGAGTIDYTGVTDFGSLTAETGYQLRAYFVEDPTGSYADRTTATLDEAIAPDFSTLAAAGGGGSDLTGTGLFIALGDAGNTDETTSGTAGTQTSGCTSMANACSEISHLGTPPTGTKVYLAEGGVWADRRWIINWEGNSGDGMEISCYYNVASVATACSSF